jgi:ribonuclease HI
MERNLMNDLHFSIHTDGGSRGNPGPAAIGVVIEGASVGKKEYGEYIGETTNNVAEYQAVVFALKKMKQLIGSEKCGEAELTFYVDSELLQKQLNREYKVKDEGIQKLFMEIWNLTMDFKKVSFTHVLREKNAGADTLVNQALDKEGSKLNL